MYPLPAQVPDLSDTRATRAVRSCCSLAYPDTRHIYTLAHPIDLQLLYPCMPERPTTTIHVPTLTYLCGNFAAAVKERLADNQQAHGVLGAQSQPVDGRAANSGGRRGLRAKKNLKGVVSLQVQVMCVHIGHGAQAAGPAVLPRLRPEP